MTHRPNNWYNRHAFSILELAVVLGVIALIAGAGISMGAGAIKAADRVTTQERLNTVKLALDSFGKTYGYLPCPASRILSATNASFGIESRSGTTCTIVGSMVDTGTVVIGALPVRTLGLPDNYAWDAWGGKLTYAASNNLIANPASYQGSKGAITMRDGTRTTSNIVSLRRLTISGGTASSNGGTLRVTYASTGAITASVIAHIASTSYKGSFTPTAVTATTVDFAAIPFTAGDTDVGITWQGFSPATAYVVVSHGPDGLGAFPANGSAIPAGKTCSATAIDGENCNDDATFFDTAYNDGAVAALYFDDYIVWGSNELQRVPVNPSLYTTSSVTTCPAGTCEAWCAACSFNFPGGVAAVPPPTITSNATLCRKIITSNATACTASCFWGGLTATGYVKCP